MHLIGVTGKAAAGKSTAADEFANQLDAPMIEMGDIVEQRVCDYLNVNPSELTSDQKGTGASALRDEHGDDVFAEATVSAAQDTGNDVCVISGVRSPEEIEVFKRYADVTLVLVSAPFETRYERFCSRGREDEADFTRDEFQARVDRELDWGLEELITENQYDIEIMNDGGQTELSNAISNAIDTL